MSVNYTNENLAYHAARLLIVIAFCGRPRSSQRLPGIEGRTLLAKLDFFLRYPGYLRRAATILKRNLTDEELGLSQEYELRSVESRMVRYLYGPWDHIYYQALAYLIGKQLIVVERQGGTEIFRLMSAGQEVAEQLSHDPAYTDLVRRAESAYRLFNKYSGTGLKDFIYQNFPEVVNRRIGESI